MNRAIRLRATSVTLGLATVCAVSGCCSAAAGHVSPAAASAAPTQNTRGAEAAASATAGRWCGEITQAGHAPYPMVMVLSAQQTIGAPCGSTEYASIPCGGRLTCVAPIEGAETVPRYLENLTSGLDRCVEGGVISVQLRGDTLLWEYRRPDGALDATAILRRC